MSHEKMKSSLENFEEAVTSSLELNSLRERKRKTETRRSKGTTKKGMNVDGKGEKELPLISLIRLRWLI